jgi:hypothetical protein
MNSATREEMIERAIGQAKDRALAAMTDASITICAGQGKCAAWPDNTAYLQLMGCRFCTTYWVQPSGVVTVKGPGNG